MAEPLIVFEPDSAAVEAALEALVSTMQERLDAACLVTATNIVREARSRLERQLSPDATGATVRGIHAVKAFDGNGYAVLSDRGSEPGRPEPIANLPLWLEKGTKAGRRKNVARTAARPFFYASVELEVGPHERRVTQALGDAIVSSGFGE